MNTKENRRTRLTKILFQEAFLQLLSSEPAEHISVAKLCRTADLNRSTFYAHYTEPRDVMREIEDDFIAHFPSSRDTSKKKIEALFNYIMDNRQKLVLLMRYDVTFRLRILDTAVRPFKKETETKADTSEKDILYLDFMAAGSLYLVEKWIAGKYAFSVSELSHFLFSFTQAAIR